jgi:drug/metabolite transporter (DMT)-like permease
VNRRWADAALVFNTVVWGSTFILVKAALHHIGPLLFLGLRFSLAAIALFLILLGRGLTFDWKTTAAGAFAGCFLFSGYALQTWGLRLTSAPKSAFLTGLTSLLVPLIGSLVYRNRPQVSEVVGVAVATAGLALMTLERNIGAINRGDILTVLCAVGFAAHIVTLGHFSERMRFELLSVSQLAAAAVLALSLFWWTEKPQLTWRPAVVYAILITGLFATALAFTLQAWAQQYTTSTKTALIYMLEPVVAWVTSFVVVGEGLSGRAAVGAALILGGVVLVEMKLLDPRLHPSN